MPSWTALAPSMKAAAMPRPSPIPPAAITGTRDRVDDLRQEREQADRFGRVGAEEAAGVAAGLEALGDDRVDAALLEPARFLDGRRIADDDCAGWPSRGRASPASGRPKWKLTTAGRSSSTTPHMSASNGSRSAPPLPGLDAELVIIRLEQRAPRAVVHVVAASGGRRS